MMREDIGAAEHGYTEAVAVQQHLDSADGSPGEHLVADRADALSRTTVETNSSYSQSLQSYTSNASDSVNGFSRNSIPYNDNGTLFLAKQASCASLNDHRARDIDAAAVLGKNSIPLGTRGSRSSAESSVGSADRFIRKAVTRHSSYDKIIDFAQGMLDFGRVGLVGRDKELRMLQSALDSILKSATVASSTRKDDMEGCVGGHSSSSSSSNNAIRENQDTQTVVASTSCNGMRCFVSIAGSSGTGKSALAASLRPKCTLNNAFYSSGKFDMKQLNEPYSGFKTAVTDLCIQITRLPRSQSTDRGDTTSTSYDSSNNAPSTLQSPTCTRGPRRFETVRDAIIDELDKEDMQILAKLVPALADVVGVGVLFGSQQHSASQIDSSLTEELWQQSNARTIIQALADEHSDRSGFRERCDRLKFAFRKFIRIVCKFCPLVWVFDDIQWADKASLDMIESWMYDVEIKSLMVVACYRTGMSETTDTNLLYSMLDSMQQAKRERSIKVVQVEVNNLLFDHVHGMLVDVLNLSTEKSIEEARQLANIVHRKTDGNVFFVQQFVRALVRAGLLTYNIGMSCWAWNNDRIGQESIATTNVVQLTKLKLRQAQAARLVLPLAACLGSTFSVPLLRYALRGFSEPLYGNDKFYTRLFGKAAPSDGTDLMKTLHICQHEGLIESRIESGNGWDAAPAEYSFIHDKVQEASLDMVPRDALSELQFRLGSILTRRLEAEELNDVVFIVTNLLNARLDLVPLYPSNQSEAWTCQRFQVAKLNYDAGSKAVSFAAFRAALTYFKNAAQLLPSDHWESQYAMSLDIYTSATECAFVCYEHEETERYGKTVLGLDCPILDKMRVYHVLMDAWSGSTSHRKAREATALGREVLSHFGYRFPTGKLSKPVATVSGLFKMNARVKKWTPQAMDALPNATDPTDIAVMKALDKLITAAYVSEPELMPLVVMESVKRTFSKGVTPHSPASFGLLGLILGYMLGNIAQGRTCASHAMTMIDKMQSRVSESRVILTCHAFVLHFTQPYENSRESLLRGFSIGMTTGDVESALWCIFIYLDMCLYTGGLLHDLDVGFSTYHKLAIDFKQLKHAESMAIQWQLVMNLAGASAHGAKLTGDAIDEDVLNTQCTESGDVVIKAALMRTKTYAAVFFLEYEMAADLALTSMDSFTKYVPGQAGCIPICFYASFACYIASSMGARNKATIRKYRRLATRGRRKLQAWANKGNPNCAHYLLMLDAERSVFKDREFTNRKPGSPPHTFVTSYQSAIRLMARRGLIHEQALANERLADFYFRRMEDGETARYHHDEAVRLYGEWGAEAKVCAMNDRCRELWPPPTEIDVLRGGDSHECS